MEVIEVPDEGHAPLLEGELVRQIVRLRGSLRGRAQRAVDGVTALRVKNPELPQ
jgi:hypothetical protein